MKKISFEGFMIFFVRLGKRPRRTKTLSETDILNFINFESIFLPFENICLPVSSSLLIFYMTIQVMVAFWMTLILAFSDILLVENQPKLSVSDTLQTSETDQNTRFLFTILFGTV